MSVCCQMFIKWGTFITPFILLSAWKCRHYFDIVPYSHQGIGSNASHLCIFFSSRYFLFQYCYNHKIYLKNGEISFQHLPLMMEANVESQIRSTAKGYVTWTAGELKSLAN
ncbi:putative protein isoform X2 [Capsicum annuum]|uniref:uncharacterized protein LOC107870818 isoform X2 n=1 Tax=Capsicum annuum TaxID=4072 RepID=UPI0007BFB42C|nr:uncharacterized protein LOC107870818 isoform X2 [Capsicum annuum]